jgi:hypothetical protein
MKMRFCKGRSVTKALRYQQADAAMGYGKFYSRSQPGEVRVFDGAGALVAAESWPGKFRKR